MPILRISATQKNIKWLVAKYLVGGSPHLVCDRSIFHNLKMDQNGSFPRPTLRFFTLEIWHECHDGPWKQVIFLWKKSGYLGGSTLNFRCAHWGIEWLTLPTNSGPSEVELMQWISGKVLVYFEMSVAIGHGGGWKCNSPRLSAIIPLAKTCLPALPDMIWW